MNYSEDIKKGIEFIESRIQGEITARMVADHVGYSLYHYCRVFLACQGVPLMEYIRKRRLSLAAQEISGGGKVINAALNFGFETPSGFSKAFRREFGFTPTQYAKGMREVRKNINSHNLGKTGGLIMNPVIMQKGKIKVAGYAIKTTISGAKQTKDVAALWDQFNADGWESRLYDQLKPPKHGEVGIFVPCGGDEVSYVLGVIVENFDAVTDDMVCVEIPEATYAVFTTPPVDGTGENADMVDFPKAIKETWRYVFEEWFKDSEYEYDQEKMDFEYYDERCHGRPDTVMDIYVPITKSSKEMRG